MNVNSSSTADNPHRHVFAWLLFPLALFPLVALLTYDWHAIDSLQNPPIPHSNWIGPLGDGFAYYGYAIFGLAIWIVPFLCVIAALCLIRGRHMRPGRRELWFAVFIAAVSSLVQAIGSHPGFIASVTERLNLADAGGAIGYLIMTRTLAPLLNDFGSSVLVSIVMVIALIAAIGVHNLAAAAQAILNWAMARGSEKWIQEHGKHPGEPGYDEQEAYLAALRAKKAAEEQSRLEKERIRAEKLAEKERLRAEKERLRAEKEAEKERIRAEKEAEKERIRAEKEAAKTAAYAEAAVPPAPQPFYQPTPPPAPVTRSVQPAQTLQTSQTSQTAQPVPDDKGPYILPSMSLLNPLKQSTADHGDVDEMTRRLIDTLKLFGVDAQMSFTVQGPVVTKYAVKLAPGTRYSAVTNIQDNLMGALHAKSLRIEAPIPGKEEVGIEVPNRAPAGISFREIIESDTWRNFKGELPLLFGKDAAGNELVADLASMPHMLVAGATGQGKSVCLNSIINGLLMTKTPEQLKLIMVDPKSVEFTSYVSIPHLIVPIITDNKKVVFSLHWAVAEMEKRLKLFARARVRNIYDFNHRPSFTQTDMFGNDAEVGSDMPRTVPYIVIIIDEVADLMASNGKEVTPDIARLTAKARAAGIHLILATQRPDAKIITGTIKANVPGRVAFKTATGIDSRTILDEGGAENLIGRGDMLYKGKDGLLIRAQGAWISDPEIAKITEFIEKHSNTQFDDRFTRKLSTIKEEEVDLFGDNETKAEESKAAAEAEREQVKAEENASDFKKAVECIINTNRASTSHFQRKLGWGYNHSAKIMDMLEEAGIIGPQVGAGPRSIIMDQQQLMAVFNGDSAAEAAPMPADEEPLPPDDAPVDTPEI